MKPQFSSVTLYKPDLLGCVLIPLADYTIQAGFPSPADDYLEPGINLNAELIQNPDSTFLARVSGPSMTGDLEEGDILIIDRSLKVKNNDIVVAFIDGEFTVKRISLKEDHCYLVPTNSSFPVIKVTKENEFLVWGVVTYSIGKKRR